MPPPLNYQVQNPHQNALNDGQRNYSCYNHNTFHQYQNQYHQQQPMVNQYGYNVQNAPPSVIHHHNYYGSNTPQRTDARGNSDPSPKVYSSNQKM